MKHSIAGIYSFLLNGGYIVKEIYRRDNKFRLIIFHEKNEITWEIVLDKDSEDKEYDISYIMVNDIMPASKISWSHIIKETAIDKAPHWKRIK